MGFYRSREGQSCFTAPAVSAEQDCLGEKRKQNYQLFDASYLYKKKIINPHPEQKEIKRTATSYFAGKGNVLDYIFISKELNQKVKNNIAKVSSYEVLNEHILENLDGSLLTSDHAQVVCELEFKN